MASDGPSLASAVVIPESDPPENVETDASKTLKRRQSDAPDSPTSSKRARLSPDTKEHVNSPSDEQKPEEQKPAPRRRNDREVEKKRGQRLFGALLGTLSKSAGPSTKTAQQRADIEKRQLAKLKQLEEKVGIKHIQKPTKSLRERRKEQWDVDSAALRAKHSSMQATARFLSTNTEPKIYYMPWKLTHEEEDEIDRQIDIIKDEIAKEREDFESRRAKALADEAAEAESDGEKDAPSNHLDPESTHPPDTNEQNLENSVIETSRNEDDDEDDEDEHHGETILETQEDTVIF